MDMENFEAHLRKLKELPDASSRRDYLLSIRDEQLRAKLWIEEGKTTLITEPAGILEWISGSYPGIWKSVESARKQRDWPDWCFVPMTHISTAAKLHRAESDGKRQDMLPILAAVTGWRLGKGIYRLDQTLFDEVWETPIEGEFPSDLFFRLPEYCIYVETFGYPLLRFGSYGFFAFLNFAAGFPELHLILVLEAGCTAFCLPLNRPDLQECIEIAERGKEKHLPSKFRTSNPNPKEIESIEDSLRHILSVLIYLCSANAEIRESSGQNRLPLRAKPTRTKQGERLFQAEKTTVWECEYRLGAALRRAYQSVETQGSSRKEGTHSSPRPHLRCAHWHTILSGPRNAPERNREVRWLPPIPVNLQEEEATIPTIHIVD